MVNIIVDFRIVTIDSNTYKIKEDEMRCYPFIILLISFIIVILMSIIYNFLELKNIFLKIGICLGLLLLCAIPIYIVARFNFSTILKLEDNSLSIIYKRLLCKNSITVYNYGELKHAAIFIITENDEGEYHFYRLALVLNSGAKIKIMDTSYAIKEQQFNYFKYLVDVINKHIKNGN